MGAPQITEFPVNDIKIMRNRYQDLNEDVVDQLRNSIEEVGLMSPITLTENGTLVSGLHRLTALVRMGYNNIPAILVEEDSDKNDIEQIDENLVRQTLTFTERAEQVIRKVSLMVKEIKKLNSANSEEVKIYLEDENVYQPIIHKLKVDKRDYLDYKLVVFKLDNKVIRFLRKIELTKKARITKESYLTISTLPKEWQYRLVNELGNANVNTAINKLNTEYQNYLTEKRLEEIKQREREEARKREEELIKKLELERKEREELFEKQEIERKKREEEAQKKREILLEKMKQAQAEEDRKKIIQKQEELERQQRLQKVEAERKEKEERDRLEAIKRKQEKERERLRQAEIQRLKEEEERKQREDYLKKYNTLPPTLKDEDLGRFDIVSNMNQAPKTRHSIVHFKDTFTLAMKAEKVQMREWIDSTDHLYRVKENLEKHESVLFICYNNADAVKVAEEIEKYS
ncbi:ParB N-terminal domain-containing protein [Cytobacillus sp. Hm23]